MAMLKFTSAGGAPKRPDDLSGNRHRQLIGHIGFWLPLILIGIVVWRDGLDVWRCLDSVSAYYYSGAVAAFAGMLVALALFLFAYDGYDNESHRADRFCAVVAGVAALGVAFFPTSAPHCIPALPWVNPWVVGVHFGSAVVLFVMFAVFSLWLFRKKTKGEQPDADKEKRNVVYLVCGIVIVVCIAWASYQGLAKESIFWPESIALIFFAISWLVKGYAHTPIVNLVRSWFPRPAPGALDDEEMSKR